MEERLYLTRLWTLISKKLEQLDTMFQPSKS